MVSIPKWCDYKHFITQLPDLDTEFQFQNGAIISWEAGT